MTNRLRAAALFLVAIASFAARDGATAPKRPSAPVTPTVDPFLSYVVPVKSLQLVTARGIKVEVVRFPLSIDFAQIVDLDEAVNQGLIPQGDYISATMVLDYSGAEITARGANGATINLVPYDSTAQRLTGTRTVNMKLDGYSHFVVSPQTAALQAFDPRLVASNAIDVANASVTVGDNWAATVVPSGNQWVRLAGALTTVYTTAPNFTLTVSGRKAYNTVASGDVKLLVTPTTVYSIGGQSYSGAAGESALAAFPKGSSITTTGSLQPDRKTLIASVVVVN